MFWTLLSSIPCAPGIVIRMTFLAITIVTIITNIIILYCDNNYYYLPVIDNSVNRNCYRIASEDLQIQIKIMTDFGNFGVDKYWNQLDDRFCDKSCTNALKFKSNTLSAKMGTLIYRNYCVPIEMKFRWQIEIDQIVGMNKISMFDIVVYLVIRNSDKSDIWAETSWGGTPRVIVLRSTLWYLKAYWSTIA